MIPKYINSFINPVKQVWEKELENLLELVATETVSHQFTTEDITAIVQVTGELTGFVLYGFNQETAAAMLEKMLGVKPRDMNELARSAMSEFASMMTISAASALSDTEYTCQISRPKLISVAGKKLEYLEGDQTRAVFVSDLGLMYIRVGVAPKTDEEVQEDDSLSWLRGQFRG